MTVVGALLRFVIVFLLKIVVTLMTQFLRNLAKVLTII